MLTASYRGLRCDVRTLRLLHHESEIIFCQHSTVLHIKRLKAVDERLHVSLKVEGLATQLRQGKPLQA